MRNLFILFSFVLTLFSSDNLEAQKQNVLYVQNIILKEELIAENFEKYILEELEIPEIGNLKSNKYLGENFSLENNFGPSLDFLDSKKLTLLYAVTTNSQDYIKLLYERDLYRDYTTVYKKDDVKYLEFKLKSKEARTIFKILESGKTILKECDKSLTSQFCNLDKNTIKWYDENGEWIEYSKKDYQDGNVNVSHLNVFKNEDLKNSIKTGAYIFVKNTAKHIKFYEEIKQVN